MPFQPGTILNNRYRIVSLLGQGGFGAVYKAWDLNLKAPCAVKENLDASPEAVRQFEHETSILSRLRHPNLPVVHDHFSLPGQGQYLVMDYIEGQDLQTMLEQYGPIPQAQALSWIGQVSDALEYMHCQNPPVIHRDIKPANVRICPDGRAILVDFGIAKAYDPQRKTTQGARAVTPGYSPWEQYGRGATDRRSDIYALGATLYAALTGQEPVESVQRIQAGVDLTPPGRLNPSVSPQVDYAIFKAMAMQPGDRFQSAGQFKAALQEPVAPTARMQVAPTMAVGAPTVTAPAAAQPALATSRLVAAPAKPVQAFPMKGALMLMAVTILAVLVFLAIQISKPPLASPATEPAVGSFQEATTTPGSLPAVVISASETPLPMAPSQTPPPTLEPVEVIIPTDTSMPVIVPSDTPIPARLTLILDQNYFCRGGPSANTDQIWSFERGTELDLVGKSPNGWWLVQFQDARTRHDKCWISGGSVSGDASGVPISNYTTFKQR